MLPRIISGLEVVDLADREQCCGGAGTYNLFQPASADEVGERQVSAVLRTRPELLASANPGCTLHVQRLLKGQTQQPPRGSSGRLMDASIRGMGLPAGEPHPARALAAPPATHGDRAAESGVPVNNRC